MRVLLLIVLVMIAEVYVFLQVVHHLGVLAALALLLLVSASGPWLVRRTGIGVWRRAQGRLQDGEIPGREMVDGVLLFAAGVLLTLPGFITGAAGALLLFPPVRALVRWLGARSLARRVVIQDWTGDPVGGGRDRSVITTNSRTVDRTARTPTGAALSIGGPGPAPPDGSGDRLDRRSGGVVPGSTPPDGSGAVPGDRLDRPEPDQGEPSDPAAGL